MPTVFVRWKSACGGYFRIKKIDDDDRVTHVGSGLLDEVVHDWYDTGINQYTVLTFAEFAALLAK